MKMAKAAKKIDAKKIEALRAKAQEMVEWRRTHAKKAGAKFDKAYWHGRADALREALEAKDEVKKVEALRKDAREMVDWCAVWLTHKAKKFDVAYWKGRADALRDVLISPGKHAK